MHSFYIKYQETIHKILFLTGFILFVYLFVKVFFYYTAPFIIGFILSLILEPPARILNRRLGMHRRLSASFCILLIISLSVILMVSLVSRIIREIELLYLAMPDYLIQVSQIIENLRIQFDHLLTLIPADLQNLMDDMFQSLGTSLSTILGSGVKSGSWNLVAFIPGLLLNTLLTLISAYFFIKDKHLISEKIRNVLPVWLSGRLGIVRKGIFDALGGYVKAQLSLMCVVAAVCTLSLVVIGSPYALFIGLLTALVDSLPFFGSGAILWPWALFHLVSGDYFKAAALMIVYGVIIILRQILEPRLLGREFGIHPLLTLMSMYIGLKVFGLLGFIIGPFIAVVTRAVLEAEAV